MLRQETKTVRLDFDFAIPGAAVNISWPSLLNIEAALK
jgi:hypothetical protein